jgi:signal transduction histidine kinase
VIVLARVATDQLLRRHGVGLASYEAVVALTSIILTAAVLPQRQAPERVVAIDLGLIDGRRRAGDLRLLVSAETPPPIGRHRTPIDLGPDGTAYVEHAGELVLDARTRDQLVQSARMLVLHHRLVEELHARSFEVETSRQRLLETEAVEHEEFRTAVDGTVVPVLDRLRRQLPDSSGQARELLDDLCRELAELGSTGGLSTLAHGLGVALSDLRRTTPVPMELQVDVDRLPAAVERALWYVATESIANAVKYADATRINVELDRVGNEGAPATRSWVRLVVRDDGRGGADVDAATGSGLRGMRERVEQAGGSLSVRSRAGAGTEVVAEVPAP